MAVRVMGDGAFGGGGGGGGRKTDDDDLYEGFNYQIPAQTATLGGGFGPAPPTGTMFGYGAPAATFGAPGTAARNGTAARGMTASGGGSDGRQMTSVLGTGYQSKPGTASTRAAGFDPLNQAAKGPAPPLAEKSANSPEDMARELEKQVHQMIEQSADLRNRGDLVGALERARDAGKKERALQRHREQNNLTEQVNNELTYAVVFNLANCLALNGMYQDALSTYATIVKNKQYPNAGRLRVNMGNIYYQEKKYPFAIKMYRMALDQIPNTNKDTRLKIQRNIANAHIRMGQFQDAIQQAESILEAGGEGGGDFQTGFNLIVCYYALGDAEKMKKGFQKLLAIPMPQTMEDEEEEAEAKDNDGNGNNQDLLREELRERQKKAVRYVTMAAKLIAPALDPKDWVRGFDTVIEMLKHDHDPIASEMQISKALTYLRYKQFDKAIEVLKAFEKKDQSLKAKAATNLSFLYFLEGDINQADKYANLAVRNDRYNAKALVNKGNCLNEKGELERAKELYLEAIGVEADCIEAIYNLGLVNKHLGILSESLQAFEKLHTIIPNSPEVMYQIANLHDMLGNYRSAIKYFNYLTTRVPSDPGALSRLGQIFSKDEDETQAFHYHLESYRYFPVNLDVISWLGVWYVRNELYEKAIEFFERAAEIQPREVKWQLMVTSCYRRMGNLQRAYDLYEAIHLAYPENLECLKYLVAICGDLGRRHDHYDAKLIQLERAVARQQASPQWGAGEGSHGDGQGGEESGDREWGGQPFSGQDGHSGGGGGAAPPSARQQPPSPDARMAAPSAHVDHGTPQHAGGRDEDDFADADVDGLLQ